MTGIRKRIATDIGFNRKDVSAVDFVQFQFCSCPAGFLAYRLAALSLYVGWLVADLLRCAKLSRISSFLFYLSNWVAITISAYLFCSFAIVLVWFIRSKRRDADNVDDTEDTYSETCVTPEEKVSGTAETHRNGLLPNAINILESKRNSLTVKWFHKLSWLTYELSFVGSCAVTAGYWGFSADESEAQIQFQFFKHGLGLILLLLDTGLGRYPCNIMHCIFGCLYGISYVIFTYILYVIAESHDPNHVVIPERMYWFLDWNQGAGAPVTLCFIMIPGTLLFQLVLYSLSRIRIYVHFRCANP